MVKNAESNKNSERELCFCGSKMLYLCGYLTNFNCSVKYDQLILLIALYIDLNIELGVYWPSSG